MNKDMQDTNVFTGKVGNGREADEMKAFDKDAAASLLAASVQDGSIEWILSVHGEGVVGLEESIRKALDGADLFVAASWGASATEQEIKGNALEGAIARYLSECSGADGGDVSVAELAADDVDIILQYAVFGECRI